MQSSMVKCAFMKPFITYPDFEKLEIRIGTVVACESPDWSKKLLKFEVDFGPEFESHFTIFSGIKTWYTPENFIGKQFPFLINLEPKKMGDEFSQGMMLMADGEEKPILFNLGSVVSAGTLVR